MRLAVAIDRFIADWRSEGRINSANTERDYRRVLNAHADDCGDWEVGSTDRSMVMATLRRWEHPNSRRQAHAILNSFYDWSIEEGHRSTVSPARQVRRTRPRPVHVYRPTVAEVVRIMDAVSAPELRRERWVVFLGLLAGLRRNELRLLQGRHFARDGLVWVSPDIGKGGKGRWQPVTEDLRVVVDEIRTLVAPDRYVTPSRKSIDPPFHTLQADREDRPISATGIYKMVKRVGVLAGLPVEIGPHTLRHAYGDHVSRYAGLKAAQALMGHASVETTEATYTNRATIDELVVSLHGFSYRRLLEQAANPHRTSDAR